MSDILLNPGPTNTRFMTKFYQWLGSDKCHREDNFSCVLKDLQNKLLSKLALGVTGRIAILGGSGTAAMEAMISSLIPNDVLVVKAGKYGIMDVFGIKYGVVESSTINDLQTLPDVRYVYFVESETSTGERYDLDRMCKIYPNAKFFIDATSSFGASDYFQNSDRIAALSFCSNKCLQSTPGLGIVIWNNEMDTYRRSYYGDLTKYHIGMMPFTLPTQSVYALNYTMLKNSNNKRMFDKRRDEIINQLNRFGITCVNKHPSNSIIGFQHPKKSYKELHAFLKRRGMVIYSGIEGIENSFRISTMSIKFDKDMKKIVGAFRDSCIY